MQVREGAAENIGSPLHHEALLVLAHDFSTGHPSPEINYRVRVGHRGGAPAMIEACCRDRVASKASHPDLKRHVPLLEKAGAEARVELQPEVMESLCVDR